jgi:hypothetical protein
MILIQEVELAIHFDWLRVREGQQLIVKTKESGEKKKF